MRTASLWPLTVLPQICAVLCVRNCKNILMQLWKCSLTLRSAGLAMHRTTMKTRGWQLQRACKTRWLSSEATVKARQWRIKGGADWAAVRGPQHLGPPQFLSRQKRVMCEQCNIRCKTGVGNYIFLGATLRRPRLAEGRSFLCE